MQGCQGGCRRRLHARSVELPCLSRPGCRPPLAGPLLAYPLQGVLVEVEEVKAAPDTPLSLLAACVAKAVSKVSHALSGPRNSCPSLGLGPGRVRGRSDGALCSCGGQPPLPPAELCSQLPGPLPRPAPQVEVSEEQLAVVLADLGSARRARVRSVQPRPHGETVSAFAPIATLTVSHAPCHAHH